MALTRCSYSPLGKLGGFAPFFSQFSAVLNGFAPFFGYFFVSFLPIQLKFPPEKLGGFAPFYPKEEEKKSTVSKSEASLESKLVGLYSNSFTIFDSTISSFSWQEAKYIDAQQEKVNEFVSKDIRINKLKGFLYCYYIALTKIRSKDEVLLKKYTKQLKNVLSAVLTSSDCYPLKLQKEEIDNLINSINNIFSKQYQFKINELIEKESKEYRFQNLKEFIEKEIGIPEWGRLKKNEIKDEPYTIYEFDFYKAKSKPSEKNQMLEIYIQSIENQIHLRENRNSTDVDFIDEIPKIKDNNICANNRLDKCIADIFNEYLESKYTKESFLESRYNFAKVGGQHIKDFKGEKWAGSSEQSYINSLLKNLNEYSEFSVNNCKSLFLRSFASFCQKGDSDIYKLEDYLTYNEIEDCRIALGLWGIIFGFAETPKTMTNKLFKLENKISVTKIYKYIFKQLHSIDLPGELQNEIVYSENINTNDTPKFKPTPSELGCIFDSMTFVNLQEEAQQWYKNKIINLWKGLIDKIFINNIKGLSNEKDVPNRTKTKLQEFIKLLSQELRNKNNSDSRDEIFTIQQEFPIGEFFYCDKNAWPRMEELLPNNDKLRKYLKNDFKWFQDNYNMTYQDEKKGLIEGRYKNYPKDNSNTIDNFRNYCIYKRDELPKTHSNMKFLSDYYKQIDMDKIIECLKNWYKN